MYKYLLIAFLLFATLATYSQVAVIANPSVGETTIDVSKLESIYSLKTKTWGNGSLIVVFTTKGDTPASDKVFSAIGKSSMDLKKAWMKIQLTGEGTAPTALNSEQEVLSKVASTPGAIGFVDKSLVTNNVKVLLVIN